MLPSMRHFLHFIDLDSTFGAYGFTQKVSFHQLQSLLGFLTLSLNRMVQYLN